MTLDHRLLARELTPLNASANEAAPEAVTDASARFLNDHTSFASQDEAHAEMTDDTPELAPRNEAQAETIESPLANDVRLAIDWDEVVRFNRKMMETLRPLLEREQKPGQ